ncbi:MAG: acyl-CoA thioesterase [Clostridiales bacterium]|nr:acyl-CoA thioesterase [Clostridiales bacterium]
MDRKTIEYSKAQISQVMMPNEANAAGNVHGGEIMKLMDNTAYVVARKHSRCNIVTARVDELEFHHPIYVGELVTCKAHLVFVGRTSMEVHVIVEVEDLTCDASPRVALTAYFTMIALDHDGRPTPVPKLAIETEKEQEDYLRGKERYELHKLRRQDKK